MSDTPNPSGRRFERIALDAVVHFQSGDDRWDTPLIDLCLRGVLVSRPDQWKGSIGDSCHVDLELDGEIHIHMQGHIAHLRADAIGVACEQIDMGSFAHLKRVVELNLGDSSLLFRELEALT